MATSSSSLRLWLRLALAFVTSSLLPGSHAFHFAANVPHPAGLLLRQQSTLQQLSQVQPQRLKLQDSALHLSSRSGLSSQANLSGNLISQLAVLAIQFCLKSYSDVSCDVSSMPQELFQGKIGPVTVKGKDWSSSRGLTCRAIEASVDSCRLDISRVFSEQALILTKPAEGRSMIALTAQDFGNFVTHPRLEKAKRKAADEFAKFGSTTRSSTIDFSAKNVVIDPDQGTVTFHATCAGTSCKCVLKRDNKNSRDTVRPKALVEVTTLQTESSEGSTATAARLSHAFTHFFNQMVFELYDGLFLSFRDMMITDKGREPSVLLSLNIRVEKFPSAATRPSEF